MKGHSKKLAGMLLACMLALTPSVSVLAENASADAAEQPAEQETEGKTQEAESNVAPVSSEAESSDTKASEGEASESKADTESKPGEGAADTGSKPEENAADTGNENAEDTTSAKSETEETSQEESRTDALEQEGEVTEPITKEDRPYLALGANLTAEQQNTVLELLGINPAELSEYDVIYITNEEEHQYLDAYVSKDKIGTRSLSSVLVVKREEGNGINITTKNISYCTIGMYKNALITAGITDADIIVAGPTPISGTAALVGALKAYSVMTGEEVSEESIDTALNELVVTGDIADIVGDSETAEELLAYLKQQIIQHGLDSEEEIRQAIEEACEKFDITLTGEEIERLITLLKKIGELDLDLDSIMSQAQSLYDKLSGMDSEGFFAKIGNFFQAIIDFFKKLFG